MYQVEMCLVKISIPMLHLTSFLTNVFFLLIGEVAKLISFAIYMLLWYTKNIVGFAPCVYIYCHQS